MLKVLLVDDDYSVRDELKEKIDWISCGVEVCAEVSDGERAYTYIASMKPDIIITDLQMPYMDGLTLSRLVKEEYPDIGIIMLTSCADFACVKEAMHVGVSEYILKPFDKDEMQAAVKGLASGLARERHKDALLEQYIYNSEINIERSREYLFSDIVNNLKPTGELIELARKYNVSLGAMWYNIILVNVTPDGSNVDDSKNTLEAIDVELAGIASEGYADIFERGIEGKAILIKADSLEEMIIRQNNYIDQLKDILYKYDYINFYGGAGKPVDRLGELQESYKKACRAFAHSYLLEENLIIENDEVEYSVYSANGMFKISEVDAKIISRDKIYKFLKFADEKEVQEYISGLFRELGEEALNSHTFRRYFIVEMYMCVCDYLEGVGGNRDDIESPDITYEILQNKENSEKYLVNIFEKAMKLRSNSTKSRYADIVDEVIRYIDSNFADDKLSLNQLSDYMNFSPNHLSMIFSQQTGRTFIKYLTDLRMSKAKELLRYTSKRSSEISIEVGYKDPHYFSYLFKKTQGLTPTQYRSKKNESKSDDSEIYQPDS